MSGKRASDSQKVVNTFSGSIDTFKPSRWNADTLRRSFKKGDLVTLAPEFRYSIATSTPDWGTYIGIVVEAFANREYIVVWTTQPLAIGHKQGMYNGDHLVKIEKAPDSLGR